MANHPNEIEVLRQRIELLEQSVPHAQRVDPSIALGIDLIDLGNVPVVKIKQTSAQNFSSGIAAELDYDTVVFDSADAAQLANDRLIVRRSGIYLVMTMLSLAITAPDTSATLLIELRVNNVAKHRGSRQDVSNKSGNYGVNAISLLDLLVGNVVTAVAVQTSGATQPSEVFGDTPCLEMMLVAPGA